MANRRRAEKQVLVSNKGWEMGAKVEGAQASTDGRRYGVAISKRNFNENMRRRNAFCNALVTGRERVGKRAPEVDLEMMMKRLCIKIETK